MRRKILAILLSITMLAGMLPTAAVAEEIPSAGVAVMQDTTSETPAKEKPAKESIETTTEAATETSTEGTTETYEKESTDAPVDVFEGAPDETSEKVPGLNSAQQDFVNAVNALDKDELLALAKAYVADPTEGGTAEIAFYKVYDKVEGFDGASAAELYAELTKEEQADEAVAASYVILQDIINSVNALLGTSTEKDETTYENVQDIEYLVYNSSTEGYDITRCEDAILVQSNMSTEWSDSWYVVRDTVTINDRIHVADGAHLILMDGAKLTVKGGIGTQDITIYAQSTGKNMGQLVADAREKIGMAGIGSDGGTTPYRGTSATIKIHGGNITAYGGNDSYINNDIINGGAGIGGGQFHDGKVYIYGGIINAYGGRYRDDGYSAIHGRADIGQGYYASRDNSKFVIRGSAFVHASDICNEDYKTDTSSKGIIVGEGSYGSSYGDLYGDVTLTQTIADLLVERALVVSENGTLTIPEGVTATLNSSHVANSGKIINNGTVNIKDIVGFHEPYWKNDANLINNGTMYVYSRGKLENTDIFTNYGEVYIYQNGTLRNSGTINNYGKIYVYGDMRNTGTILPDDNLYTSDYLYYNESTGGFTKEKCVGAAKISNQTEWAKGWYVVEGWVDISSRITVSGEVHLILKDGCKLNAVNGINIADGSSLTVYAQSSGSDMGQLVCGSSATGSAAIGSSSDEAAGTITLNGGKITATSSTAAGIGGGSNGAGGTVTIHGGEIIATSSTGAGIGDSLGGSNGKLTVTNAAVIFASSITDQTYKTADTTSGIIFEGTAGRVYGDQTISKHLTAPNENSILTVPIGAKLTIADNVQLNNITVKYENVTYDENGFGSITTQDTPPDTIPTAYEQQYQPAVWDATWNDGEGRYEIANAGQMYWFAAYVNEDATRVNTNGVLKADIDLQAGLNNPADAEKRQWTAIGNVGYARYAYTGTFDGNGHLVSGMYNNLTGYNSYKWGFFGVIGGGTIQKLNIAANITGNTFGEILGGICGYMESGKILDCNFSAGSIDASNVAKLGGICGYMESGEITGCDFSAKSITGSSYTGGICGYMESGEITDCSFSAGSITASTMNYIGGICGYMKRGQITDCSLSAGSITGTYYVGGICGGMQEGIIRNCYNTSVEAGATTGGYNQYVGGICGYMTAGSIDNCYNSGTVTGNMYIAGICGMMEEGTIQNSYNTGEIEAKEQMAGGINGQTSGTGSIQNCYNTGTILGIFQMGGISGSFYGTGNIQNCYNTGTLITKQAANGYYIGGISGNNKGSIQNCYNIGTITITDSQNMYDIGGICGNNYSRGLVQNCYNTGNITITDSQNIERIGSICGNNYKGTIQSTYFLTDSAEQAVGTNDNGTVDATEKSSAQFASGEVTYLLNGSRYESTTENPLMWYQKLTAPVSEQDRQDAFPTLDSKRGIVYSYTICTDVAYYTNDSTMQGKTSVHSYDDDGICIYDSGHYQPAELDESDGYYKIVNAGNLMWLSTKTNSSNTTYKVKLMNGIDLSPVCHPADASDPDADPEYWISLGTSGYGGYHGIFDGQGFTIRGLYGNSLFYQIAKGSTVKNLIVEGVVMSSGAGICRNNYGTIENCVNKVAVSVESGNASGICQSNQGGMIQNCINMGTVKGGSAMGGICGLNIGTVQNCYNNSSDYNGDVVGESKDDGTTIACESLPDADFKSGRVAYLLNGSTSGNNNIWRQTLDGTSHPVPNSSGKVVYAVMNFNGTALVPVTYQNSEPEQAPLPNDFNTAKGAGGLTYSKTPYNANYGSIYGSIDGGKTWQNFGGDANYRVNFENLPSNTQYDVRLRYSGSNTMSASEIFTVADADSHTAVAAYTVTIPKNTTPETDTKISVSGLSLGYNGQVNVKVDSENSDSTIDTKGVLTMTRDDGTAITSQLYVNNALFDDTTVKLDSFTDAGSVSVKFDKPQYSDGSVMPAGKYTGTVYFEISYEEVKASE